MKYYKSTNSNYLIFIIWLILINLQVGFCEPLQNKKVSIGVITALSGPLAIIGTAVKNGIELARSDRPELFKNITFEYQDDQYDGKLSISSYRKLKSVSKVNILLGFGSVLANTIGTLSEKDRIPFINFNFEYESAIGKKYLIRSLNPSFQYMKALANYLEKTEESELQVLQTEASFFNSMVKGFKLALLKSSKDLSVSNYNPSDTDFRTIILKLKIKKPKYVGLFLLPNQLVAFMKQAKTLGLKTSYFGTDLFETAASIANDNELFKGCLYPDNQVTNDFHLRYKAKFKNDAQLTIAGNAYEITILLGELLQSFDKYNNNDFLNSLYKVKNRPSVLGSFSYHNQVEFGQYFKFPVFIKSIGNEKKHF